MAPTDPQWQGQPEDFPLRKTGKNIDKGFRESGPEDSKSTNRK